MGKYKQELNQRRHQFLLTFFPKDSGYMETWVNGYWLIKQWNGNTERWEVAIYSQESFEKKAFKRGKKTCQQTLETVKTVGKKINDILEENQEPLPWEK